MKVYFVGAGPGDPELLTLKGQRLISSCSVCIYAGSLVPSSIIDFAPIGALLIDSSSLTLDEIIDHIKKAASDGKNVVRLQSGDPSLYGAIAEQIRILRQLKIDYEIIPGVSSVAATAARLGQELTLPQLCQSIVFTRTSMKSSSMPEGETLENFARTGALLAIHLSARNSALIIRKLSPYYGVDCPVVIASKVGWKDELIVRVKLGDLRDTIRKHKLTRNVLILVGRSLAQEEQEYPNSSLYDPSHPHILRPIRKVKQK